MCENNSKNAYSDIQRYAWCIIWQISAYMQHFVSDVVYFIAVVRLQTPGQ